MGALANTEIPPSLAGERQLRVGLSPYMVGDRRSFGEEMRRRRKARRMSLERLAELAESDKGTLSQIEGDPDRQPGHNLALRIIAALEAPPEPFLRALGYPLDDKRPQDWRDGLWDDDRINDDDKQFLERAIRMAFEAAERRDKEESPRIEPERRKRAG